MMGDGHARLAHFKDTVDCLLIEYVSVLCALKKTFQYSIASRNHLFYKRNEHTDMSGIKIEIRLQCVNEK